MGSTVFPKLIVKVYISDKSDYKTKTEKGFVCNWRHRAAVPWLELSLSVLLQGSRGKGEVQRAGRMGAELTALPLFVAGEI